MAVHVGEIHTDVLPAPSPAGGTAGEPTPNVLGVAEQVWRDAQRYALTIACRTAAEGFDD